MPIVVPGQFHCNSGLQGLQVFLTKAVFQDIRTTCIEVFDNKAQSY